MSAESLKKIIIDGLLYTHLNILGASYDSFRTSDE